MNTLKNWTREQRQRKSEKAVSVSIVFFLFFLYSSWISDTVRDREAIFAGIFTGGRRDKDK